MHTEDVICTWTVRCGQKPEEEIKELTRIFMYTRYHLAEDDKRTVEERTYYVEMMTQASIYLMSMQHPRLFLWSECIFRNLAAERGEIDMEDFMYRFQSKHMGGE